MKEPVLIIDTNYLCHRAWHAMGSLAYGGEGTGVIFGVMRDIITLQDEFKTGRCVFVFDHGKQLHRHTILPTYKSGRQKRYDEETDIEKEARADFRRQVVRLRTTYLPMAGFNNVVAAAGFEADDLIAGICRDMPDSEEVVIISSDQDLYQCLRPNVYIYNPHKRKCYTMATFIDEWGLEPRQWPYVKALAGCGTDDVPGVPGVGERTAAKWLRGELGAHTKAATKLRMSRALYKRNIQIVRLPYPGTPTVPLVPDAVTEAKWQALSDELGIKSIKDHTPRTLGRRSKGRKRKNGEKRTGFGL